MMKKYTTMLFYLVALICNAQQIEIPRIETMRNLPLPYSMRDWQKVAHDYDKFVFNTNSNGQYLPLTRLGSENGYNYPEINPIYMDTYVGHNGNNSVSEAINVMPAIVGASLVGIDKSNQEGINWVKKTKNYFNVQNGQNLYLNGWGATTGGDWWYEVMPNVFFIQLMSLYPNLDSDFNTQLTTVADRKLEALIGLGGKYAPWTIPNMNYRAYNFATQTPNSSSVPEPETAGSIAWILYQTYLKTGIKKYLTGAELSMDFLQNWNKNPSYEIQLPYGILAAARMNAEQGTNYDIKKMLDWTFGTGIGTLRGWGMIVGTWGGYDVSGLIGEANDGGNDYAFSMNGFQHAAALAPVAKYDKRFARAIGKWILHVANASRLFYHDALPNENQESTSCSWAKTYDKDACIPYESMKEKWNSKTPFIMGDAVRGGWAKTDLSLYSGSSVGYLAALLKKTNIEGILQINLNSTDFNGENLYPTYLYYNPLDETKEVEIELGDNMVDIYETLSEKVIKTKVSGRTSISIAPNSACVVVLYPANSSIKVSGRIRQVYEGGVLDYHYKYNYSSDVRVKSIGSNITAVQAGSDVNVYSEIENGGTGQVIEWFQDGNKIEGATSKNLTWKAPTESKEYKLHMKVTYNNKNVSSEEISILVVPIGTEKPSIKSLAVPTEKYFDISETINIDAEVELYGGEKEWSVSSGTLTHSETLSPKWTLPNEEGVYTITLKLTNILGSIAQNVNVLVKDQSDRGGYLSPVIYYPFNGDSENKASNSLHATEYNVAYTSDVQNRANSAVELNTNTSYLRTENSTQLGFKDAVAISFWVSPKNVLTTEQFILSHGSWEERYKVSLSSGNKLRWTIKTVDNIVDIDDDINMNINNFYHYVVQYTGYSAELYRNGQFITYAPLKGDINSTNKDFTIGRKEAGETNYTFQGIVDEFRVYDQKLPIKYIEQLPSAWNIEVSEVNPTHTDFFISNTIVKENLTVILNSNVRSVNLSLYDVSGHQLKSEMVTSNNTTIDLSYLTKGSYFIVLNSETTKRHFKIIKI